MTFKIGDKVRLAPHVTDEMLESIYIEDDSEKENRDAADLASTTHARGLRLPDVPQGAPVGERPTRACAGGGRVVLLVREA